MHFLTDYNDSLLQSLIISFPIFGNLINILPSKISIQLQKKRLYIFFEKLKDGKIRITEDNLKSNEFLHATMCTMEYVSKTHDKEKIEFFSNLYKNYIISLAKKHKFYIIGWQKLLKEL